MPEGYCIRVTTALPPLKAICLVGYFPAEGAHVHYSIYKGRWNVVVPRVLHFSAFIVHVYHGPRCFFPIQFILTSNLEKLSRIQFEIVETLTVIYSIRINLRVLILIVIWECLITLCLMIDSILAILLWNSSGCSFLGSKSSVNQ